LVLVQPPAQVHRSAGVGQRVQRAKRVTTLCSTIDAEHPRIFTRVSPADSEASLLAAAVTRGSRERPVWPRAQWRLRVRCRAGWEAGRRRAGRLGHDWTPKARALAQ